MENRDIEQVVKVHLRSFPDFFLSFLGSRFLHLFYSSVCSAPEGIALVYLNSESSPAGFVVGAMNPQSFYSRLLKHEWLKFSLASISAIYKKPQVIRRILRAFFHPSKNPKGNNIAGLFSLGVLPDLQSTGVGKKLVHGFLREAKNLGCVRVFLTTDRDNNEMINAFYSNLRFKVERQFKTPEGRRMNEYWIDVT
jgi:ribosomal protein S18 acetylase RimI-like enzyme